MTETVTIDAVAKAMADDLTTVFCARLGTDASAAPSDAPSVEGWTVAMNASGSVTGRIVIWIDRASAGACARVALQTDGTPSDDEVATMLQSIARDAATAVQQRANVAGVVFAEPVIGSGLAPAGARAFYIAAPNVASCLLAVGVERTAPAMTADRLGAVLGVDLPLVVRFGRTVMPMRAVAELGPGAIIDMGRTPEEPVDVLVGDRLIARGEVVVVGGNYGVRLTTLASGRDAGAN